MTRINFSSILHLAGKLIMNKNEIDIGNSKAEKTCSLKPDGHIKESHSQNFLGQLCVCRLTLPGCSPQYEINEFPVTWLIVLLEVWARGRGSCTSQPTWCYNTSGNMYTDPRRVMGEHLLVEVWVSAGATGKGSCCWTRTLLTHGSWQGYRWPTSPSVHHQRRGKCIVAVTSWKQNTLHS